MYRRLKSSIITPAVITYTIIFCWVSIINLFFLFNISDVRQAKNLKEQCEASLPRNQYCTVSYVPRGNS